ncbi:MAG: hypothetical protein AB7S44_03640 [Spirochaetales bacterium]
MELTQETITLIINGVFAFFVVMGFLFGVGRGAKKSGLRLVFIVSIAVVMYFLAPYISSWLLTYDLSSVLNGATVTIGGSPVTITTLQALMQAFIDSSATIQDFVSANPSFLSLVEQLPAIVTNLVIFLGGFWILKIITWPFYAIMASHYNKKNKDGDPVKKHRFAGGFIGAVQGVAIALITFMPVAGVSSIINVEGTDGSGVNLLGDFLPEEIVQYLPVYENSALGIIGGIGGFDEKMFDGLTTITITNDAGETIKIKPRQEAATGMEIAGDIEQLITMIQGIQSGEVTDIDWDLIENLVDKIFDLNSLQLLIEDYAPYLANEFTTNAEYGYDEMVDGLPANTDVREFISEFINNIDEATMEGYKTDVLALVHMGEALDNHGAVDLIFQVAKGEITGQQFGEQMLALFASDRSVLNDVIVAMLESNSLRTLMPQGVNVALGYIEAMMNEGRAPEATAIVIDRLDATTIDWEQEAQVLTDIAYKLVVFVNSMDPFNLDTNGDPMAIISQLQIADLGEVINLIMDNPNDPNDAYSQLFGGIASSLIDAIFSMPQVEEKAGDYVDLPALKAALNTTDWATEFGLIQDAIDLYVLIDSTHEVNAEDIVNIIQGLANSDLLDIVLDGAIRAAFIEGLGETEVPTWATDLDVQNISDNAAFFAQMIDFIFNISQNGIEGLTNADIDALVTAVQSVDGDTEFIAFFDNLMQYGVSKADAEFAWASSLHVQDLIDNVDTLAEFFKLGVAIADETFVNYTPTQVQALIDSIADLDNMSPELIAVLQGVYDDLMAEAPFYTPIVIANIDWATESDILKDAVNIYLYYLNNGSLDETLANTAIAKLSTSYVADTFFATLMEQTANEEEAPAWMAEADITWVSNNAGLAVSFVKLVLWADDNDLNLGDTAEIKAIISQTQIDELNAGVAAINATTPALVEFKAYLQAFVTSITPDPVI